MVCKHTKSCAGQNSPRRALIHALGRMGKSLSVLKKRAEAAKLAPPANSEIAVAWHLRSLLVPSETVHWNNQTISGPWLQETWVGPEDTWELLRLAGIAFRSWISCADEVANSPTPCVLEKCSLALAEARASLVELPDIGPYVVCHALRTMQRVLQVLSKGELKALALYKAFALDWLGQNKSGSTQVEAFSDLSKAYAASGRPEPTPKSFVEDIAREVKLCPVGVANGRAAAVATLDKVTHVDIGCLLC